MLGPQPSVPDALACLFLMLFVQDAMATALCPSCTSLISVSEVVASHRLRCLPALVSILKYFGLQHCCLRLTNEFLRSLDHVLDWQARNFRQGLDHLGKLFFQKFSSLWNIQHCWVAFPTIVFVELTFNLELDCHATNFRQVDCHSNHLTELSFQQFSSL